MRHSFSPRLVNDPFGDPGLFIPFMFQGRALLFDLGLLDGLSNRDILKISHVFISHTHMDHFVGFDRLLRLFLARDRVIHLFGPEGFIENVGAKLGGYAWNLLGDDPYQLQIRATEVGPDRMRTTVFSCPSRFRPAGPPQVTPFEGILLDEPALTVSAAILDHGIPCLGLALTERFHINIRKDRLAALGAAPGPWLARLKAAVYERLPGDTPFRFPGGPDGSPCRLPLGELVDRIVRITPGLKCAYITDAAYTDGNLEKIVALTRDADHLFIEAAFLAADAETAEKKSHLTARQAGRIARLCRARRLTVFHFSPRYLGREDQLYAEAEAAWKDG